MPDVCSLHFRFVARASSRLRRDKSALYPTLITVCNAKQDKPLCGCEIRVLHPLDAWSYFTAHRASKNVYAIADKERGNRPDAVTQPRMFRSVSDCALIRSRRFVRSSLGIDYPPALFRRRPSPCQ
jgi:hypothetical protein